MGDQAPIRRPAFVTQRDGSALANSNCRMASIAMGLDGAEGKTSTGAKMRSYTSDQSGGTDSGDAREAWDRGYGESLDVEDGRTFADALAALKAGRIVHLDVWHAAVGRACLSGSGAYGHTIVVLPDHDDRGWAVGDPWCSPEAGYARVLQSQLAAGAETWGGQVYGRAALESDWPSGGPIDPRSPVVLAIVRRIVKRLMSEAYPTNEGVLLPVRPPDTGGAQPILYTQTKAVPMQGGGGDMPGMVLTDVTPAPGTVTMEADGPVWRVADDTEVTAQGGTDWRTTGTARYHKDSDSPDGSLGRMIRASEGKDGELYIVANSRVTFVPDATTTPPPPADDLAVRQGQWDVDAAAVLGARPK